MLIKPLYLQPNFKRLNAKVNVCNELRGGSVEF